ncbi:hypothetical protein [Holdemanella biformis]|uniref:hypothetical protein n=1 Tax=Holdemanella biformis TaxID=1735 RepID=UPI002E7A6CF5|nr:hypothetical protein [Holdemanella biformis]MEE0394609.1 hypothetical protein [Holdemanella biformis]
MKVLKKMWAWLQNKVVLLSAFFGGVFGTAGYAIGTVDGVRTAIHYKSQCATAEDSLAIYREFADQTLTLLEALGIDDDSVDPFYDGDDAKAYAVSSAYRRFCDAYNKLAGIDSLQQLPPTQTHTEAR